MDCSMEFWSRIFPRAKAPASMIPQASSPSRVEIIYINCDETIGCYIQQITNYAMAFSGIVYHVVVCVYFRLGTKLCITLQRYSHNLGLDGTPPT